MTLPTNITLPLQEIDPEDSQSLFTYLQRLVYALTAQLQIANLSANGSQLFFSDTLTPTYPFIQGSTAPGTATYTNTSLITRRTNLLTFVWFDINWTVHTGTGNLLINVPYFAQLVPNNPFSCVIESDNMTFGAGYTYLTGNLTPNTNTIGVFENGSAVAIQALPLPANGHIRGSIVYAGQSKQ